MLKHAFLTVVAVALAATALAAQGGVPWTDGNLEKVLLEAKDRNVPMMLYVGNDT